jgi:hypothetical protein
MNGIERFLPGGWQRRLGLCAQRFRINYVCAGINHQAWFLRYELDGEDLLPRIRLDQIRAMTRELIEAHRAYIPILEGKTLAEKPLMYKVSTAEKEEHIDPGMADL